MTYPTENPDALAYMSLGSAIDVTIAARLKNWRSAKARSALGLQPSPIMCVGDSTTQGTGSRLDGSTANSGDLKFLSWPSQLATKLAARGLQATWDNYFGNLGAAIDSRLSVGSWTAAGGVKNLAGNSTYSATGAGNGIFAFTPLEETDTIEITFLRNTSLGSLKVNANGGADTTYSTAGALGVGKATFTTTLGANTYNITWASGGGVYVVGVNAYNSALKPVSVLNYGRGGNNSGSYTGLWGAPADHFTAHAPSLVIFQLGTNCWLASENQTTVYNNVTALLNGIPSTADLIMMSPLYGANGSVSLAAMQAYEAIFRQIAAERTAIYIDQNARTGGYASANTLGMMNADGVHGSAIMYGDEANALTDLLLAA